MSREITAAISRQMAKKPLLYMAGLLTDLIYSCSFEFISIIEETTK
jgi:hypothetical protein